MRIEALTERLILDYIASRKTEDDKARETASAIVEGVRSRGFAAVAEYSKRFDGVEIKQESAAVSEEEKEEAEGLIFDDERLAMLEMKHRVEAFAKAQKSALNGVALETDEGTTKLVFKPVERVGIYVPAGRFPLFSSLFMAALPAIAAGVKEIIICTPLGKNGKADKRILAAARMCGVEKIFKIGGAQAIASMVFGLDGLLEPVDVICGPGNAYVSAAKSEVTAKTGVRIDVPAGPSEVLVIADGTANPAFVAADMLAQAEHGEDSAAVCICTEKEIAGAVGLELEKQLEALPTGSPAKKSIPAWGKILIANSVEDALAASEMLAPEHLELMAKDAKSLALKARNAGAVFIRTAETFCDYGMSGGNHILPTNGAARAWGGVSVQTFGKWVYVEELNEASQRKLAGTCAKLARMEGLEAHARAAEIRAKGGFGRSRTKGGGVPLGLRMEGLEAHARAAEIRKDDDGGEKNGRQKRNRGIGESNG